ncbi:MAG: polyprenyl synthetase family protein [Roseitalea sp.]|jgi:geranylgeranyl diphosphate synthase type II|nr:polyprenyl synthetase family protein [Roseitalea sp.]MBO6723297.1 polyprenyl synthetase family protein [Roseitalea sp.]MBO6742517.1 polyprenyl synthetase family protein [Roseitalea sp.]
MDLQKRIERALETAIKHATAGNQPPKIAKALRYAVFPGGARVRPRLCLAVAMACGDDHSEASDAAAVAIELLHCASLVHDDMPCFDNADVRRGKPSVHTAFSEPLALLAGDALIIAAFETIARQCVGTPHLIAPLTGTVAKAVGMPHGLVAGQAWESEDEIPLVEYHRAKTASLFTGATMAGAIAAGANPQTWRAMGDALGAAYQVADDLRDFAANEAEIGKPCRQDDAHGRPNAVATGGLEATIAKLHDLVGQTVAAVPDCPGAPMLRDLIAGEAKRLMPKSLASRAA